MSDTFDRSQLDGKDREQLSEIASALGIKSISRLRKADLVDAIVNATASGNGDSTTTRKVRSTKAAGVDDLASLADEENALASAPGDTDEMALIRPRRRGTSGGNGTANGETTAAATTTATEAATSTAEAATAPAEASASTDAPSPPREQQWREDDQGNRRRRRRRGRDRDRREGGRQDRGDRNADYSGELIGVEGLLDLRDEGYGFLRSSGYIAGRGDAYVSASQVRRFGLRKGDYVKGATRPPASSEKYPALVRVDLINSVVPDEARNRARFEDL